MLRVAEVLISLALALEPMKGQNPLPQDTGECLGSQVSQATPSTRLYLNLTRINSWVSWTLTIRAGIRTLAHGCVARHANHYIENVRIS